MINDKYNALGIVPGLGGMGLPGERQADALSFQQAIGQPAQKPAAAAPAVGLLVAGGALGAGPLVAPAAAATVAGGSPSASGFSAWMQNPVNSRAVDDEYRSYV